LLRRNLIIDRDSAVPGGGPVIAVKVLLWQETQPDFFMKVTSVC